MVISPGAAGGFHGGELAVQRRAGVQAEAARLSAMVAPGELRPAMAAFAARAAFGAVTARDRDGRLWTSALIGPPGFLSATSATTMAVTAPLPTGDPLHDLPADQPAGLVIMDFASRRRLRINGVLTDATPGSWALQVGQAYGNCPQYITPRQVPAAATAADVYRGETLRDSDIRFIEAADTFFLGTTHPTSGNDASHRGGPAGFVRATPRRISWPDFPGNNMFNSLGNLAVDPTAALLFADLSIGTVVRVSGTARLLWEAGDGTGTGRRVQFDVEQTVVTGGR